ncbi:MAG: NAD-dependent epimerase/dehydratase family protein [SAR202 cluster bacterium]|nr:NAD-dependent epimerase/dehydratase family protein [SAR202 cluster bacterium]
MPIVNVVTGAFSYTGRYVTQRLLARDEQVRTLTNHPERAHPFGDAVPAYPLDFRRPDDLARAMRGAEVLYSSYWMRYPYKGLTYDRAVEHTRTLVEAAKRAGVRRVVHVSISGLERRPRLPYFVGKVD